MTNIEIIEVQKSDGTSEQVVKIDRGNEEFTWMSKTVYDEMQAKVIVE
jgi:hypothetical protein